jgi:hypothetical protein
MSVEWEIDREFGFVVITKRYPSTSNSDHIQIPLTTAEEMAKEILMVGEE